VNRLEPSRAAAPDGVTPTAARTRCTQCRRFARLLAGESRCTRCAGMLPLEFAREAGVPR
jgi:hypothetical protein